MSIKVFLNILFIVFIFFSGFSYGAIPALEREALIALYKKTNGGGWEKKDNWKGNNNEADGFSQIGTEGTWYGVTVSDGHVTELNLRQNRLSSLYSLYGPSLPGKLGNLVYLKKLDLAYNWCEGHIPPIFSRLSHLEVLDLAGNYFEGFIPYLGTNNNLKYVDLSFNDLSRGSIPPSLGNLANLEWLALTGNRFNGGIPPELGNLGNLKYLGLRFNELEGDIPPELAKLTRLEEFDLSYNEISGIPPEIKKLDNLKNLDLRFNQLERIPPELGNLNNLKKLLLDGNYITRIPGRLGNLKKLEILSIWDNRLRRIPLELGNLENLQELLLTANDIVGEIPEELGNLENLKKLNLSYNNISGKIPEVLANLTGLQELSLSDNNLSGTIPKELGNLLSLEMLFLSRNNIGGTIPKVLGNLSRLQMLYLSNNKLSGPIPEELGNLINLKSLSLNSNRLIGRIPLSFLNLTELYGDDNSNTRFNLFSNGLYTNNRELREFLDIHTEYTWDMYQTIAPANVSASLTSSTSVRVSWTPIAYKRDTGGYNVYYRHSSAGSWTYAGMTADKSASYFDITGLPGDGLYYFMVKTQTDHHARNTNTVVSEASNLSAVALGAIKPLGLFDTPENSAIVRGSVPVTGWALDDTAVESVKIYLEENKDLVYIGEAIFVEGARPDIEQTFPDFPNNHKAGWGYMLLTNLLPNGGNGTFNIHAVATDTEGNQVTLGIKTIICDNANAVIPFGTIDTPKQGGTASGNQFINWGWVLTPKPNSIPTDGSTINVWVDGVKIGHPTYNNYRADIAGLFPGYANSDGAVGYFYLDTTAYENGVHTIQWTAADDAGNTDGIGSRYFTIQNITQEAKSTARNEGIRRGGPLWPPISDGTIPIDYSTPVRIKKGYNTNIEPQTIYHDENGNITIRIKELERLEIHLFDPEEPTLNVEHRTLEISSLPIGATLDAKRGVFCWQPGVGFVGEYRFVFIATDHAVNQTGKNIVVKIKPRFSIEGVAPPTQKGPAGHLEGFLK